MPDGNMAVVEQRIESLTWAHRAQEGRFSSLLSNCFLGVYLLIGCAAP